MIQFGGRGAIERGIEVQADRMAQRCHASQRIQGRRRESIVERTPDLHEITCRQSAFGLKLGHRQGCFDGQVDVVPQDQMAGLGRHALEIDDLVVEFGEPIEQGGIAGEGEISHG
ncbi:MAG: hypothetical protein HN333_14895 [Rhodospirillaceae bacterium]|nr:hypothetical protein [Rhodospirillaceae bacterium]